LICPLATRLKSKTMAAWLRFGKKTIRPPRAPRAVAARDERKGRELVMRDGDKEVVMGLP